MTDNTLIWDVRTFIYSHFAATAHAPDLLAIAHHFTLSEAQAAEMLYALHEIHAIFLEPGTTQIRIANPFSGVPTPFVVDANGQRYWANCAWDSFGVIAALHATDGVIHANCAESGAPLHLQVHRGEVVETPALIHILVPFRDWYQNMVFT